MTGSFKRRFEVVSAISRERRMSLFVKCCQNARLSGATVLDIGGTLKFWKLHHAAIPEGLISEVDIVNLPSSVFTPAVHSETVGNLRLNLYSGNALDRNSFRLPRYDIAHSISVVEHVGERKAQELMTQNIINTATFYWVQTPAKIFPIEPHFMLPFFAYWPLNMRAGAIRHFQLGSQYRQNTWHGAKAHCKSIRLLTISDMRDLFRAGTVVAESLFGFTKGYTATNMPIDAHDLEPLNGKHFSYRAINLWSSVK